MGYIKEPKGVDFTVIPQSKPDIEVDRMFSEFLSKRKLKSKKASIKKMARETSKQ